MSRGDQVGEECGTGRACLGGWIGMSVDVLSFVQAWIGDVCGIQLLACPKGCFGNIYLESPWMRWLLRDQALSVFSIIM